MAFEKVRGEGKQDKNKQILNKTKKISRPALFT